MKHVEHYTLRWHDTDVGLTARPGALVALMQETSNLQFARSGKSLDDIREERGVGFVLSRIALDILRAPRAFEELRVETFTEGGHGFTFLRGFEVFSGDELLARCHSAWALLSVQDKSLIKYEDFPLSFGDEPEVHTETPLRFRIPRDLPFAVVGEKHILYSDLDYNYHMNNTKYPDMVRDFLPNPGALRVTGMSLAYYREAAFGDVLTLSRATGENGIFYFRAQKGEELCFEAMLKTVPV